MPSLHKSWTTLALALSLVYACGFSPALASSSPSVNVTEVQNYVFGGYRGSFKGPHHADGNPKRAFIISWSNRPERFVFWHEASYCPFLQMPDGAALSYQFFEGNDGHAELFNDYGRLEKNSSVAVVENTSERVCVRWKYNGVTADDGTPCYKGVEYFWAYPNGLIVRSQTLESLMPDEHVGYAREPIETIAMCPVGKLWYDVLEPASASKRHALLVLDPQSGKRYDVYWTRKPGTLWKADVERTGCDWQALDDASRVIMAIPFHNGLAFCAFGDASGFNHKFTHIKEHSFKDTGGLGWKSLTWDHWPIGWINSQSHDLDAAGLRKYPNHFSPAGLDLYDLPDKQVPGKTFYSLIGIADNKHLPELIEAVNEWFAKGADQKAGAAIEEISAR